MLWNLLLTGLLVSLPSASGSDGAFKLVVNQGNAMETIGAADLAKIFLKRKREWSRGNPIQPIDQSTSSPIRGEFSREILNMSLGEVRDHWMKVLLSGRDVPPVVKENDALVLEFVQTEPGAIGYVSAGAEVPDGVKLVALR